MPSRRLVEKLSACAVAAAMGALAIASASVAETPDWLKNGIIYQIFPDRFYNGDVKNDVKSGSYTHAGKPTVQRNWGESPKAKGDEDQSLLFFGGDLSGIKKKLSYIRKTVGANIIYLTPIFKAPRNHKYDTADYDIVDPAFGINRDLEQLSSALHKNVARTKGRLILDGVFNHTGDSHKWFGKNEPQTGYTGAYQSKTSPYSQYYTFTNWPNRYAMFMIYDSLPQLNFASKELKKEIYAAPDSIAIKYLKPPFNIDGWRLDAAKHVDKDGGPGENSFNHEIWRAFREAVKTAKPDAALIGEYWENASPWLANEDQWDSATNFDGFTQPVSRWITGKDFNNKPASMSASEFERTLRETRERLPAEIQQSMSNHLSNHDISRFGERSGGDLRKTQLGLIFMMTYVGVPTIYYGDEYGMTGDAEQGNRKSMDWTQANRNNDCVRFCGKLAQIRNKYSALRTGKFETLKTDDDRNTFCFARVKNSEKIVVVLNNSDRMQTVEVPVGTLKLSGAARVENVLSKQTHLVRDGVVTLDVPAFHGAILVEED